ncbi:MULTISPECIES: putative quinol monooxygenase [Tatumella]|uniref:Antibiotic biosynthesis monooxygenase n=1 Tax=Tatumella ptyseos TaxID=82987 RepID=A0A2X5P4N0_9GAMM|nr:MULTISPECIES: antibiotic biosynthesis monooxygenase family protein [Tatumella]SQK71662.1 Antibiotic biosynthesis monooxygenase [Tatumella ptyseos]
MSQVITVIASITAKSGEEKVVAEALKTAEKEVQGEPGCESYVLHRNISQPQQFIMLERWSSRQHLDEHEKAPAFQKLAAALNNRASLDVILSQEVSAG